MSGLRALTDSILEQQTAIEQGGGEKAVARQHAKNRLTARERLARLFDKDASALELGLWAGYEMYSQWDPAPAAGVITAIGAIAGQQHVVIANDATVKAGAFFPATAKKVLRAQKIAFTNRIPLVYLVDSAGIFLPLQEDVFPDEDDFGRIFRNNAVMSAAGIPQLSAIMGNCVAGGGYLPVLCDKLLMTDGSGLYLAGPALVKSAIGQEVSSEELGGAQMHAEISGTIDYREPTDEACLAKIRELIGQRAEDPSSPPRPFARQPSQPPARAQEDVYDLVTDDPQANYDVRDVLECLVDANSFQEYKKDFGQTLVCGTARIDGYSVGIVANQKHRVKTAEGEYQFGGVIYVDSAEKAARFVMDCNQQWLPLIFIQDVNGFMVGRTSERAGIIKAGAKMVSAVSNSRVPKITMLLGGSYGAGNYALCGKGFDPRFIFAWPGARCAVMGGGQATSTLVDITVRAMKRDGNDVDADEIEQLMAQVHSDYERQTDVRYAAARGWVDAVIQPCATRNVLSKALSLATREAMDEPFRLGVFQV